MKTKAHDIFHKPYDFGKGMPHRTMENNKAAIIGSILGSLFPILDWIFKEPPVTETLGMAAWAFLLKFASTVILGAGGAVAGMLAKDVYSWAKERMKNRKRKNA